eukprot:TRINITY_DN40739_c0_g1_i1.p1 TRINITY_DN40739_c0_g1~~TRINITY_DN40739_c0_g1_i1.p1  ORF type:complete len:552 (-),score=76.44 TRINITY_DN40739_c0_g1_i1:168-1634(-)
MVKRLHERSSPVSEVDIFLSHTWHTAGWMKALQLHLRWCAKPAAAMLALVHIGIALLQMLGCLPRPFEDLHMELAYGPDSDELIFARILPWNHCVGTLLGLIALLLFPRCSWLWTENPVVFLDAACICQHDDAKKRLGIAKLDSILLKAKELHVLWSPEYMTRLWCVYELAAFTRQKNPNAIHFQPTFVEPVLLLIAGTTWLVVSLYVVVSDIMRPTFMLRFGCQGLMAVPHIVSLHVVRMAFRQSRQIVSQLENFDAAAADCTVERDREFVLGRIAAWHGSTARFNEFVRTDVRRQVAQNTFTEDLPYTTLILPTSIMAFGYQLDLLIGFYTSGMRGEQWAQLVLETTVDVWLLYPVLVRLLFDVAALTQAAPRRGGKLADVLVTLLVAVVLLFSAEVATESLFLVRASGRGLFCSLAVAALWVVVAYAVFTRCRLATPRRTTETASEEASRPCDDVEAGPAQSPPQRIGAESADPSQTRSGDEASL